MKMIDNYKNKLKSTLSEKRYKHSLGVCDEAVKLAEKYGADTEKAYTAGILHDCAKGYDTDEQIKLCQKYGVVLDDSEYQRAGADRGGAAGDDTCGSGTESGNNRADSRGDRKQIQGFRWYVRGLGE